MNNTAPTHDDIAQLARAARQASRTVATLDGATRNAVLRDLADRLEHAASDLLSANAQDLAAARESGLAGPKLKRLVLTPESLAQTAEGLRQIAELPDPVGAVTHESDLPSGLKVQKVRAPLGVVAMIYEARPAVTVDAFALCFKAGNSCLLKGGREAARSNRALAELARAALAAHGAPEHAIAAVTTTDREQLRLMLTLTDDIDLVIPRGGEALIRFVAEHARVPTVQHFHGVCHAFVDRAADLSRAIEIVATAKTSAPATCNTLECVLVDRAVAPEFLPRLAERLVRDGVELRADVETLSLVPGATPATDDDWGREYLDLILACRVVGGLDEAVEHVHHYGSNHTEVIVTEDEVAAAEFVDRVHSSCVLVNASSRFNDGFQLGLGAEIGISTSRVHAYGPMGVEELTCQRWVVHGSGQTR
ncbi:MAG: glutamate-5-semialdehyde dehydrogenase [Planctomycetota bacterium]